MESAAEEERRWSQGPYGFAAAIAFLTISGAFQTGKFEVEDDRSKDMESFRITTEEGLRRWVCVSRWTSFGDGQPTESVAPVPPNSFVWCAQTLDHGLDTRKGTKRTTNPRIPA
jgi:hypothetical protein